MQVKSIPLVIGYLFAFFSLIKEGSALQLSSDTSGMQPVPTVELSASLDSAQNNVALPTPHTSLINSVYILDTPDRQSYIAYKLFSEKPNQFLISDEYLASTFTDKDDSIPKQSRPRWVLFSVFALFFLVGLIRVIFPTEFKIIIEAYYRERLLQQVSKEDNLVTSWPYICLYAVFSFALGLFLVVAFSEFKDPDLLTPLNFVQASLTIAVLFIAKIVLTRFISFVFKLEKIIREYVAIIYLMYFNSMLVLLPFLLFIVLIPVAYFNILLIIFVVSASILFIYRILRTSIHLFEDTQFSISYLILYLCTLEIAPILLLIRTLGN